MPRRSGRILFSWFMVGAIFVSGLNAGAAEEAVGPDLALERYAATLSQWQDSGMKTGDGGSIRVPPTRFSFEGNKALLRGEEAFGYEGAALPMKAGDAFVANVTVPAEGLYRLSFDYYLLTDGLRSAEYSVQVHGSYPYAEARRIGLPAFWRSESDSFPKDRFGNEVMPTQVRIEAWQTASMTNPSQLDPVPMAVRLKAGDNAIRVALASGELLSGDLIVTAAAEPPSYEQYAATRPQAPERNDVLLIVEAEKPSFKNDTTINPIPSRDAASAPYDTNLLLLNAIGGRTWKTSGQSVYYEIDVPKDGYYRIAAKYAQSSKKNARTFRTFTIDGDIPFAEAKSVPFPHRESWTTKTLGGEEQPYLFYLAQGKRRIGVTADAGPYADIIPSLQASIEVVNDLNLEIRKLVGNDVDQHRDWEITEYLPTIQSDLLGVAERLQRDYEAALALNGGDAYAQSLVSMRMAVETLKRLAKEPNDIPHRLSQLNGGTGSVTQNLSEAMQEFENQPLSIDQLYIYGEDASPPSYGTSWFRTLTERIKQFFYSFAPKRTETKEDATTLDVWLNRPRSYMDLLQRLTDEQFTPRTGVKINFSTLPNEGRLTLATASGTAPDLALGISNWVPFELGVRGAALDLRRFDDFDETAASFSPGSFLPMMINDEVYGMPETQDFYVLFYRKDILDSLGIPIPDTWEDVIEILPELQRYGMNFYTPLAGMSGTKPFTVTASYIYQNGGSMFGEDAFRTGLDSPAALEGIRLMTDLNMIYGLPMQIPNFFEHFRSGTLPIGISNFKTYVQMQIAAPELMGAWKIAPAPGVRKDGETVRWHPGSAQVSMIFKETEHPDEAWEFMKWWLSDETQVRFANQLQTLYGKEFLYNTANLDAFEQLAWPEEDKAVIKEQWRWLLEVPKTPGGYMIERELSNIWNKVVLDGDNIRSTVEESVIEINKEIARKMEELGYLDQGNVVVPYRVPEITDVEGWGKGRDDGT